MGAQLHAVHLLLLAVWTVPALGSLAVWAAGTSCCQYAGLPAANCSGCLVADVAVPVTLPPGASSQWHFPGQWLQWLEHAQGAVRFELELCHGAGELHVQRAAPLGADPQLNASSTEALLALAVPWDHANFWARAVGVRNASALLRVRVEGA